MMKIFGLFATPLGYLLRWIYMLVPSYFIAIFLFTLLVRIVVFPLSIKTQKGQADRARLAPRLERIQKKYANDRQKLQQKQQELYEKEGVSMTGGCLPIIIQMLILMSIIAVIYKPMTYVQRMPAEDISACVEVVQEHVTDEKIKKNMSNSQSYYQELYLLNNYEPADRDKICAALVANGRTEQDALAVADKLESTREEFKVFGISLLELPNKDGIKPNWLWVIALLSGLSALLSSIVSMRYSKATMPEQQQKAGGCSTNGMMYTMPLFSLIISFTVPGGVAMYWVFSNLLAMVQTVILNHMYNPVKIRQQAEAEYAERRRKKLEDKERLKKARLEEQAAWQREENEKRAAKEGKKPAAKKPAAPTEQTPAEEGKDEEP